MQSAIAPPGKAGDVVTLTRMMETYEAPLGRYLRSLTGSWELSQDLVQETFLQAYLHLSSLRDEGAVKPWLYRIATNLAMTALKRRNRFRWLPLTWLKPSPGFEAEQVERDRVQTAIGRLPAEFATCLLLTRVEGLKSHEAAGVLGISAELVRKRVQRAQELLRRELGGDGSAV